MCNQDLLKASWKGKLNLVNRILVNKNIDINCKEILIQKKS